MAEVDNFIREQFDRDNPGERFPFREEHWAQALPLIEAAERKRRRRGLLWCFLGLLLLGGGALWGWHIVHSSTDAHRVPAVAPQETLISNNAANAPLANSINEVNHSSDKLPAESEILNASKGQLKENVANQNNKRERKEHAVSSNVLEANYSITKKATTIPSKKASITEKRSVSITGPTSQSESPLASTTASTSIATNNLINSAENSATTDSVLLSSFAARQSISTLQNPFLPLSTTFSGRKIAQVPYNFSPIKPLREPRFAFGLSIAASAYRPAALGQQWGATAGFYAAYWLRPSWSLSAGIMWRGQPASEYQQRDTLMLASQLRYSFGYEEKTFQQVNHRLKFMELPLSVRWQHRSLQVEAGAILGQLTGARATLIQSSRSSLSPEAQITEQRVKGEIGNYNSQYIAPLIGLGWQPLRFLQVGIRASYRPTSLLKSTAEYTDRSGAWRIDAGLRWQLFSNDRIRVRK